MSLWNRRSPGSLMQRKLISKFNVAVPLDSQTDLCIPYDGKLTREMDEEELYHYEHLCNCSLPRDDVDHAIASRKSAEAWTNFAPWIRSLAAVSTCYPGEMKNWHSRKGKSRLRILMAAATFGRFQWYLNNAQLRTTLSARESALMGTGTCGNEALHAELRGVFRQVCGVSLPTFRLKMDLVKLSKLISFDAARRIPMLLQMNHGRVFGNVKTKNTELPFQSFSK